MQPESSDGFASVGTILPKERAALLPGGSFRFYRLHGPVFFFFLIEGSRRFGPLLYAPQTSG
jgi:hypothetical protein